MLQDMIKAENRALDDVSRLEDDVIQILEIRGYERSEFKLKIDLLDWDRNHKIRGLLQNKVPKSNGVQHYTRRVRNNGVFLHVFRKM